MSLNQDYLSNQKALEKTPSLHSSEVSEASSLNTEILFDVWYAGALSSQVKEGKMYSQVIMGQPLVFYRDSKGTVHGLRNICPHRGIPFSFGQVIEDQLECPYHGWKFNHEGVCTEIPSLLPDQGIQCQKIKIKKYPVLEKAGIVWVFMDQSPRSLDPATVPPPWFKDIELRGKPQIEMPMLFDCHIDHAVIGLMDPAHGPFVHKSIFWRSKKSILEKSKKFGPEDHGFQMRKHRPSANSKAYKVFGGERTTEITFSLPGVRIERIQAGLRNFYSVTALTPLNENQTLIYQLAFWDMPLLTVIKPFIRWFSKFFLNQDREAVVKQQEGLKFKPALMLIKDADTQAKWYYALKKELLLSRAEKREFVNPVPETTLRWRS